MIWETVEITATLIECILIESFFVRFLGFKTEEHKTIKIVTGFLMIAADELLLPLVIKSDLVTGIMMLVACFAYSMIFLKGNIYIKIFAIFLGNVIILIINSLVLTGFSAIYDSDFGELISSRNVVRFGILLSTKFLYFLCTQVILALCRKQDYKLNKTEWAAVGTIFLTTLTGAISVFELRLDSRYSNISSVVILSGLVLINVSTYFFMVKNSRDNREKVQSEMLELQLSEQRERVEEINEMYDEILQIRHDMKKCVTCAAAMIDRGNVREAKEYLEKTVQEKIGTVDEYIILESKAVSAVINSKLSQCRKEGIEITASATDYIDKFNETDISILLANLFDNAIEACRKVEGRRYISFLAEKNKGYLRIIMKNSAPKSESKNKKHGTTKLDKKNHGYGIKTVKELTEKYEGMHDFFCENGEFTADIWLKILK